jgi:hypothetical protein
MILRHPRALTVALFTTATLTVMPAAVADELPPTSTVDCSDATGNATALAEAKLAADTAKRAFTSLRGPMSREVKQLRAEARAAAKQARQELRGAKGAEAKAARAELRAAMKTLGKSNAALAKQVKAERKATKAAWDEAKSAYHELRAALEGCEEPTDDTGDTDDTGTGEA